MNEWLACSLSLHETDRWEEPERFATNGLEVRKPVQSLVFDVCVWRSRSDELLPKLALSLGVNR